MLLVGNDVIDLTLPSTREKFRDARFLSRVFSPPEEKIIQGSSNPNLTLWTLWAAKESAFKIISKIDSPTAFSFKEFQTYLKKTSKDSPPIVQVTYRRQTLQVTMNLQESVLHGVAVMPEEGEDSDHLLFSAVTKTSDFQGDEKSLMKGFSTEERASIQKKESAFVRYSLKQDMAKQLDVESKRLQIIRPKEGARLSPPFLLVDGQRNGIDISLSHHGQWIGWAYTAERQLLSR